MTEYGKKRQGYARATVSARDGSGPCHSGEADRGVNGSRGSGDIGEQLIGRCNQDVLPAAGASSALNTTTYLYTKGQSTRTHAHGHLQASEGGVHPVAATTVHDVVVAAMGNKVCALPVLPQRRRACSSEQAGRGEGEAQ